MRRHPRRPPSATAPRDPSPRGAFTPSEPDCLNPELSAGTYMPEHIPVPTVRASRVWLLLAAFFFSVSIVAAVGEWVFHWWDSPGDVVSFLGLLLGAASIGLSASSGQVEAMGARQDERFDRLDAGQREHTAMLRELVQAQRELVQGQREQTAALREVVASFRSQRQGPGPGMGPP